MKVTEPGYYWATGPNWFTNPARQVVKVSANLFRDSTYPEELIVQMVGDTAGYNVSDFRRWIGPLFDPLLPEEQK